MDKGEPRYVSILEIPPIDSEETTVKIAIAAQTKNSSMRKVYYALYRAPFVLFLAAFLNPFGSLGILVIVLCAVAVIGFLLFKISMIPGHKKVSWVFYVMMLIALVGAVLLSLISHIR